MATGGRRRVCSRSLHANGPAVTLCVSRALLSSPGPGLHYTTLALPCPPAHTLSGALPTLRPMEVVACRDSSLAYTGRWELKPIWNHSLIITLRTSVEVWWRAN